MSRTCADLAAFRKISCTSATQSRVVKSFGRKQCLFKHDSTATDFKTMAGRDAREARCQFSALNVIWHTLAKALIGYGYGTEIALTRLLSSKI